MRAVIAEPLAPLAAPIDTLALDPDNANRGDVAAIRKSLNVFGQRKPVVVRRTGIDADGRPTGIVVAGNHTLMAAVELGWDHVAAVFIDDDASTAKAYALADNRTGELSSWDNDQLAASLRDLTADDFDMTSLGWSEDELAALLIGVGTDGGAVDGLTDPDDVPDPPAAPTSVAGDVWLLGPHRLLCGDATDVAAVEAMLSGEQADCMWTDPPYGVEYVGKTANALTIRNDGAAGLPELLAGAFAVAAVVLRAGSPAYVATPSGPGQLIFSEAITGAGWSLRQQLVWDKGTMVLGHSDYHYRHEPIWLAYTANGVGRLGRGGDRWYGDHAQTSVFEVAKPSRSEQHPTMKPVELVAAMLGNSCPPGGLVYEPFGGSGSSLIAAHRLGMRAAVIEIEPAYVDVICRRYQEHSGVVPVLASTGEPHNFIDQQERPATVMA